MPFPTLTLLDSFKRNESELGEAAEHNQWKKWLAKIAGNRGTLIGSEWETKTTAHEGAYWSASEFTNGAVAVTRNAHITSRGTWFLLVNISNPTTELFTGYDLAFGQAGGGTSFEWKLRRWDTNEEAEPEVFLLESGTITLASGQSIGLVAREGKVEFWRKKEGTWELIHASADSKYTKGFVGFWAEEAQNGDLINFEAASAEPAGIRITNPGDQIGRQLKAVHLKLKGTGIATWSATGLPAGLTINSGTGEITGEPTTLEETIVHVKGENEGKTETAEVAFRWTILEPNGDLLDLIL